MKLKLLTLLCVLVLCFSITACAPSRITKYFSNSSDALSGTASSTVNVAPTPISSDSNFEYDSSRPLAESFKQMNSLRMTICNYMYSAVVSFSDDSAWVPVACNNFTLGSSEFLAASYVMEKEPNITAKKLFREEGFKNVEISQLDIENTYKITATKADDDGKVHDYIYTVMYGAQSDSYRFTLTIDEVPTMMFACRRTTGGYVVQIWTPEGEYRILAQDIQEGRFGFIPKSVSDKTVDFPQNDIYYDDSIITKDYTVEGADYTFLLANNILYISRDGANYAVPLR